MPVAQPTYPELVDQIRELKAENEALRKQIAALETELRRRTGESEGTGGAPAAREVPAFVRPARARKRRRKPGRPPGHEGACRPVPDRIDRTEDVPAPDRCPRCDEPLEPVDRIHEQIVEEIPPVEPQVVRYCFHGARCPRCRHVHYGYHPAVLPGSPLGMQVMLFVAYAKLGLGLSYGKIQQLLLDWFHLRITTGGLAKLVQRTGRYLRDRYEQLINELRRAAVVHADETGWYIDGRPVWLWTFTNRHTTVFVIADSRGAKVVEALLGLGFDGILIADFLSSYNSGTWPKQRCLVHLLRELHKIKQAGGGREVRRFVRWLKAIIRDAMALKTQFNTLELDAYSAAAVRLHTRLDRVIAAPWTHPDCVRLVKRLIRHREELLTFLAYEEVEADNNRSERSLRPSVIVRKLSGGNRSERGARAHEVILSFIQTCRQRGESFFQAAREAIMTYLHTHYVTVGT